ncbi:hypothetical protein HFN_0153 [Helicobacter fennelliae MRY12-0050]|uniref:Uncharacterized protein n=1 Tax=Helicobacter fennelliae MRY12-0050 TaxID=1325130 RepID=T1DW13_9HELI|nr:hypothetical protein HFN_0153 [Helicobacter fennelliae MRY12-0050]
MFLCDFKSSIISQIVIVACILWCDYSAIIAWQRIKIKRLKETQK